MSFIQITRLTALSLLLIACADKTIKTVPIKPPVLEVKTSVTPPKIKLSAAKNITILPIWVEDHRLVNYISAIGTSKVKRFGGDQAQYNAAMQHARRNLSIAFKQYQTSLSEKSPEIDNQKTNVSTLMFKNVIVKEEWKHPKTGQLYLWVVIPAF